MNPNEYLDEVENRAERVTPGPWDIGYGTLEDPRAWVAFTSSRGAEDVREELTVSAADSLPGAAEHDATFIAASRTDVPKMAKALRAVLGLHRPFGSSEKPICNQCEEADRSGIVAVYWPCPTVRAITEALEGEE